MSPHFSGVSPWLCSSHLALPEMIRLESARSLRSILSAHSVWGLYLFGIPGRRSHVALPNRHIAGDVFVAGSGPLRY